MVSADLSPPFVCKKNNPEKMYYPGRANFSYISLQNLTNRLQEKQKVGQAFRW